jgi:OmpA-OmpF porin, OOP family
MNRFAQIAIHVCTVALVAVIPHGSASAEDTKDHPLLSRIAGVEVHEKTTTPFDVVKVRVNGKLPNGDTQAKYEGRVTRIKYFTQGNPPGEVAIYRNYLAAAKKMGGRLLNQGFDADDAHELTNGGDHLFALAPGLQPPIAVLQIQSSSAYDLTIIEPESMKQSVESGKVQAAQLAQEIRDTGFATIHINFDTGKSDLKDDGVAAVKEISALLKGDPGLKISIEGHTDNVGTPQSNKQLSHARASSVMQAVVAQGTDAKRLKAVGHGQESPVGDNRTEAGQAQNRRVELVRAK